MALETVRVYAVDENGSPLSGVLVRVFSAVGVYITQNTTAIVGGEAYAEFTLDGDTAPVEYTIRMSKTGVAFDGLLGDDSRTPQTIGIYSPPAGSPTGTNYFQVQGQTFTRPAATDPRLCRASGFFRDVAGRPLPNIDIQFINIHSPLIVDGDVVLGSKVWGRTDSDGYFVIDLYRDGEYRVNIESLDIDLRAIVVPDASSVNLISLLFPSVASVAYDPSSVTVAVGSYVDVEITITDTTGITHEFLEGDVTVTSEDASVASIEYADGKLRVTGVEAGTTTITATRDDTTIVVIPEPVLTTLSVTVT
jgi:uncharacterized protein YjdB